MLMKTFPVTPMQQEPLLMPAVDIKYLISTYHYQHSITYVQHSFAAVSVWMQYYLILIYFIFLVQLWIG